MANGRTAVVRHPTIPMSKRDSQVSSGSRLSLVSSGGVSNRGPGPGFRQADRHWEDRDFINTNPNMVAGKKRAGKKVKRTDSYRIATERQSAFEEVLAFHSAGLTSNKVPESSTVTLAGNRKKYNTLPIKPGLVESAPVVYKQSNKRECSRGSHSSNGTFSRTESQKSGRYYPSPDTDDDERSVQPDRKKKSAFRKIKERLTQTFRRDSGKSSHRKDSSDQDRFFTSRSANSGSNGEMSDTCAICGKLRNRVAPREDGILHSIRKSFRRKRPTHKLRPACTCSLLPAPGAQSWRPGIVTETPDQDAITDVFSTLIDPATSTLGTARHSRSKLRLEGLRKFKPRTVEHGHVDMDEADGPPGSVHAGQDLSPDVEVDAPNFPEEENVAEAVGIPSPHQGRDALGKRLAVIGDRIEEQRRESSSASEAEGNKGFDEKELLRELREFADDFDEELFKRRAINVSVDIMPIVRCILLARDFSGFQRVIRQELSQTIGWDQVAWYTYLVKTAMYLAGNRNIIKYHATRYFNTTIRPWIQSRPNGWESIYEETDVDSEVD